MFKITGVMLVFMSTIFLFTKKSIVYLNTYRFMKETARFTDILKFKCNKGMTYPQIFADMDFSSYKYMKTEMLSWKNMNYSMIDRQQLIKVSSFISSLGKRNLQREMDFLQENKEQFLYDMYEFKEKYEKSMHTDAITGISAAVIIIIMLI